MCLACTVLDEGGINKIIQASNSGYIVRYNSCEVSQAIMELANNKNKMLEMGKKAKKWIKENRTFEQLSTDIENVYEKVLSNRN